MWVELGFVAVEVDQLVISDVTEVAIDVFVSPNADEHRFRAVDLDADVAEDLVRWPLPGHCHGCPSPLCKTEMTAAR
jgi:hypothetical protein